MSKKEEILFEIDGFKVFKGRIYEVLDKPDGDAPTGYVKAKTSKLPSLGIDETFSFRYVDQKGNTPTELGATGQWNTGFYRHSPCYRQMDESLVQIEMDLRIKNVLEPYQAITGEGVLEPTKNPESLDRISFRIYAGQKLMMNEPLDVMTLYAALLGKKVAPDGQEKNAKYSQSFYKVVDVTASKKQTEDSDSLAMDAIQYFLELYNKDKVGLDAILRWADFGSINSTLDQSTVRSMFMQTLKAKDSAAKAFVEAYTDYAKNKGKDKILIHHKLKSIFGKNSKLSIASNGVIFYGDYELSGDLKTSAEKVANSPTLTEIKTEILTMDLKKK